MSEMLSREDGLYSETGLRHDSKARNLLQFIQRRHYYHTSHQNSDSADLKERGNRFILEVIAKTGGISLPNSNTPCNPHNKTFQLIIAILDSEKVRIISN
jgi:hypothetical protein